MAAITAACVWETTAFFRLPAPLLPSHKVPSSPNCQFEQHGIGRAQISPSSTRTCTFIPRSISSPENPVLSEEVDEERGAPPSFTGCPACGREEIENGCNGEGRIQGGIATVPGFGWWPIKAYRPCPAFVASGGRYRRTGQSMDEVVSGSSGGKDAATQSSKKRQKQAKS